MPSRRTADVEGLRSDLIARMDARLSGRIAALGKDLAIRLGGMLVVAVGAMAALVKPI